MVGSERRVGLGSRVQMERTADGTHTRPATHALGCRVGAAKTVCVVWCPKCGHLACIWGGSAPRDSCQQQMDWPSVPSSRRADKQLHPRRATGSTQIRRPTLLSAPPSLDKATAKHEEGKNKRDNKDAQKSAP